MCMPASFVICGSIKHQAFELSTLLSLSFRVAMAPLMKKPAVCKRPSSDEPLAKGPASKKAKSVHSEPSQEGLTDEKLQRLSNLSLKEKVAAVAAEHPDDALSAQETLQKVISPKERQSAWQQHQAALKADPLAKGEHNALSKKEKGTAVLQWLLQKSPTYAVERHSRGKEHSLEKRDRWLSQKEADQKWTEQELELLVASGRVIWREDPQTPGVFEYKDTKDFRGSQRVVDKSSWERVREEEVEDETGWEEALGKDLTSFLLSTTQPLSKGKSKGSSPSALGKGKSKPGAKSKALGHGKGKLQMALEDGSPDEEKVPAETQAEALQKARKMRDLIMSTLSNLEESIEKGQGSKWVSPNHVAEAQGIVSSLQKDLASMKKYLAAKSAIDVSALKKAMLGAAAQVKEAKDTTKELASLCNKTSTRVG